jgi:GNAT superfamily N-acetyltransferase
MTFEILDLSADDPDPSLPSDRSVSALAAAERRLHGPDRHVIAIGDGTLVARCSCWWRNTPTLDGKPLGAIGHYAAAGADAAAALLSHACSLLARAGCSATVGPMDGNTWRRYRFVVDRGTEPPFFLEPDNHDAWPAQWEACGFSPLTHYTSAVNDDLSQEDPRTAAALPRLAAAGIAIRSFDRARADEELRRMFRLSLLAFGRNFLYSPLSEEEFMAQNRAVLPFVREDLILLAEQGATLVGFMFALPDVLQARRSGAVDTVILKTIAVDPAVAGMGLGGVLMDLVQRTARRLGFTRAIHALMHEGNVSRRISHRYARQIRRYALFERRVATP